MDNRKFIEILVFFKLSTEYYFANNLENGEPYNQTNSKKNISYAFDLFILASNFPVQCKCKRVLLSNERKGIIQCLLMICLIGILITYVINYVKQQPINIITV